MSVRNAQAGSSSAIGAANNESRKGMVLPFQPLPLAFNHVNYYVDMPAVSRVFHNNISSLLYFMGKFEEQEMIC